MNNNYMHVMKTQMRTLTCMTEQSSNQPRRKKKKRTAANITLNQFLNIKLLKMEYVGMHRGIGEVLQRPC